MAQHPTGKPPSSEASERNPSAEAKGGFAGDIDEPSASAVAAYLRRHPDFLSARPDLVAVLTPPERELGEGVIDLQRFMVDRLRADVARLKLNQRKLIATSRNNLGSQAKVHAAVLALLSATTFEHLISVVTDEMTLLLDIDAVGLCVETSHGGADHLSSSGNGVQLLEPGAVDDLLGENKAVLLRADVSGDPALFGSAAAGLVRSDALVRLNVSSAAPIGLLALGARRPGVFHPGQGTELLSFLAHVIEYSIRAWLDLPE